MLVLGGLAGVLQQHTLIHTYSMFPYQFIVLVQSAVPHGLSRVSLQARSWCARSPRLSGHASASQATQALASSHSIAPPLQSVEHQWHVAWHAYAHTWHAIIVSHLPLAGHGRSHSLDVILAPALDCFISVAICYS
jgi:hypothetical protein